MADETVKVAHDDALASMLGLIPSGLSIITVTDGEGRETGMLASWVMQAAFDPPAITIAINRKRYLTEWLSKAPQVVVNLLAEGQAEMLKHFGKGFAPDARAFEGLEVGRAQNGLTTLDDCLGFLEGHVTGTLPAGDHIVYLVEVTGARRGKRFQTEKPYVHIRKDGLKY